MMRRILILGGLLLIAAALCLTLYNLWDDQRAGRAVQQTLEQMAQAVKYVKLCVICAEDLQSNI